MAASPLSDWSPSRASLAEPRMMGVSSPGKSYLASSSRTSISTDRKSTRLNSSHTVISYAVFCLRTKEHTSELQSHSDLVCRLLLEKKKKKITQQITMRCRMPTSNRKGHDQTSTCSD